MLPNNKEKDEDGIYSWRHWAMWIVKTVQKVESEIVQCKKELIKRLDKLELELKEVEKTTRKNHDDLLILKTKVALIGAIAGLLFGVLGALLFDIISKHT